MKLRQFIAALIIAGGFNAAKACGSAAWELERYYKAKVDQSREGALLELGAYCDFYLGGQTLGELVLDAKARGLDGRLIAGVFERYRCFPDVAGEQLAGRLNTLAKELDVQCPTNPSYVQVKVDNRIRLRKRPRRSSRTLSFITRGELLDLLARQGEWTKVRHWNGDVGFVLSSQIEVYKVKP